MKFLKQTFYATFFVSIIIGCKKSDIRLLNPDGTTNLTAVVFAIVDGNSLTAANVRDTVLISAKIAELAKKPIKDDKFSKWANHYAFRIMPRLVSSMLLEHEARRKNVVISPDDVAQQLAKYNKLTKQNAASIDELAPRFGDLESMFRRQFDRDCLLSAFFREKTELQVTDEDLKTYFTDATNRYNQALAINADAWKRGEAIYSRLKSGEKWEKVAKETSEDALLDESLADNWKDWVDAPLTAVEYEDVQTNVETLAVGSFTRPIETSEGLVIIKLLGIENDFYHCARILLRMAYNVEIPTTDAARKELAKEKMTDFQTDLLADLREKAKIEYPMGKKITFKIWPEAERPRREKKFNSRKPKKSLMDQTSEAAKPTENKKEKQAK